MREALESAGITNYPSEYWHSSCGDQGWAYRGGHSHAIYDSIEPPNYRPKKSEQTDDTLEWIADESW